MLTLKVRWQAHTRRSSETYVQVSGTGSESWDPQTFETNVQSLFDERTIFVPAARIDRCGIQGIDADLTGWDADDYADYRSYVDVGDDKTAERQYMTGSLVQVTDHDGDTSYWLVSEAWVLGPDGSTIERIAP